MKRSDVGPLAWALWLIALGTVTAVVEELHGGARAAAGVVRDVWARRCGAGCASDATGCGHTPPDADGAQEDA